MDVPPAVVTVTSTVPAAPGGLVTVIDASLLIVNEDAGMLTEPKAILVAPVNPVPVIVTRVPPVSGPDTGEIPVTIGAVELGFAISTISSELLFILTT